ncbi:VWA domain-containing protein [Commensalibacter oyaizuii]|uniref:VWA domain-containing protein n=1 Tax=Commensalibacter oyaizuii TaxID=3043873 RepID=A0ABT6Q0Y3_9PROT|nr:VWA domain-containing protein [Commensalibacter sp. TBRC 16381]MDI2090655.1 VWA domain-containing protein [Commensalibacter sp. TBRC 16381]
MLKQLTSFNLHFDPLLPFWALLCIAILCAIILCISLFNRSYKGILWRFLTCFILLAWLSGPIIFKNHQQELPQTLLILMDKSDSMSIGERQTIAQAALTRLLQTLPPNLHPKIISFRNDQNQGTNLFQAVEKAANQIPTTQLGGVIVITDGQIHDVPKDFPKSMTLATHKTLPLYALLPASHEQTDRSLKILHTPAYTITGKKAEIKLQVNDNGISVPRDAVATLTILQENQPTLTMNVPVGSPQTIQVPVTHNGKNLIGISVFPLFGEISDINNHQIIQINGIRDKLKVLLVSSSPNQGERAWRSLLKSDPSVDLVHFTILRSAEQDENIPANELALIPFPINELFMQKINLFDLIILDGFENRNSLPPYYLAQIVNYVRKGGGLFLIAGPEYAQNFSLQNSPLRSILPAHVASDRDIINTPFKPELTPLGKKHPVTKILSKNQLNWGSWYRYLKATGDIAGQVLMQTPDQSPLLILNHVDKGRVALLLSDQLWLWSKGAQKEGPQAELLRRLSHWLMKEPELEEEQLKATIQNKKLTIYWENTHDQRPSEFTITSPSGQIQSATLTPDQENGSATVTVPAKEDGIWKISNEHLTTYTAAQLSDPIEMNELAVTATQLSKLLQNHGYVFWLGDHPNQISLPKIETTDQQNPSYANATSMKFPKHVTYTTTHQSIYHILSPWMTLILGLGCLFMAWYRESKS